jgi:actin-like ATPase involved in cell morphogenesis
MIRIANRTSSNRADIAIDLGTANTIVVERGAGAPPEQPMPRFETYRR